MARLQASMTQGKRYKHHFIALGPKCATPIVLVHGFLGDMFSWQYCMVQLTRYSRVIALDLPGHGFAHEVKVDGLDEMADWLEDALDILCVDSCHVVAHSFGAWIALQTALRHPHRIRSLCLIACAGLDRQSNFHMLRSALDVSDKASALQFAQALFGNAEGPVMLFAHSHLNLLADSGRRYVLKQMLDDMVATVTVQSAIDWTALRTAVKFLWSSDDIVVPIPDLQVLPQGADISMRNDGGHVLHITQPTWVNDQIGRFLASYLKGSA